MPVLICADHRASVERPNEFNPLLDQAKSPIDLIVPASTTCPAPRGGSHLIDTDLKSHSWLRSTNGDWSAEGMTIIAAFDAWLKVLYLAMYIGGRFKDPASTEGAEQDRLARINGQDWRIVARKGPMQRLWRRFDTVSSHTLLPPCWGTALHTLSVYHSEKRSNFWSSLVSTSRATMNSLRALVDDSASTSHV